eukprot:TRINITY_DN1142_c0_g1_i2.p1 TRINITY_DN1142_c0_g1~~TRINITY_DN1142_c0_g1_i2.p1  ORF type:complete len:572 (-),score=98.62 TRINITY_DN1142_c0_g1_i2:12307-13917(-)
MEHNQYGYGRGRGRGRGGYSHRGRGGYQPRPSGQSATYYKGDRKEYYTGGKPNRPYPDGKPETKREEKKIEPAGTKGEEKKKKGQVVTFTVDTNFSWFDPIDEKPKEVVKSATVSKEDKLAVAEKIKVETKTEEVAVERVDKEEKKETKGEEKTETVPEIKTEEVKQPESKEKQEKEQKKEQAKEQKKEEKKKKKKGQVITFTASADSNFSWYADPNDKSMDSMPYRPPPVPIVAPAPRPTISYANDKITDLDLSQLSISYEKQDRAKKGFLNTHISCYVNVVLQALLACTPFYNLLLQLSKQIAPQPGPSASSSSFLKCFAEIVKYFEAERQNVYGIYQRHVVESESIFSMIISKFDMNYQQQDCQEFLCYLLDGMHKEFLSVQGRKKSQDSAAESESEEDEDEWMEMGDKKVIKHNNAETANMEKSFITDIFGGIFKSELTAHGKSHTTATYEPFYLISLDISQADTVPKAMQYFFREEELSDYVDEFTKEKVKAKHKQCIDRLPAILIIHLKRFVYSRTKGTIHKLQQPVYFA